MRIDKLYVCEICERKSEDPEVIQSCEESGIFNKKNYPAGLMFRYLHSKYIGIFAFAEEATMADNPHFGNSKYLACMVNSEPRLFASNTILTNNFEFWIEQHQLPVEQTTTPEFEKMVDYLKSLNLTPSYYNENSEFITL